MKGERNLKMYCIQCGAKNVDNARYCYKCGEVLGAGCQQEADPQSRPDPQPVKPVVIESHMAQAILVMIFCFLPLGIAAVVNSAAANSNAAAGRMEEALAAANRSNVCATIGVCIGLIEYVLVFVLVVLVNS